MPEGSGDLSSMLKAKRAAGPMMNFNGVSVSYPTYLRLMELQKKVLKLDKIMAG